MATRAKPFRVSVLPDEPNTQLRPTTTVPGAHGGGKLRRGNPGNRGNRGGAPHEIRQEMRSRLAQRLDLVTQIADGRAVEKTIISLAEVLEHAECPRCQSKLRPKHKKGKRAGQEKFITLEAFTSAKTTERLAAIDLMAKYGLGTLKEISVEDVKARLQRTMEMIQTLLPEEEATRLLLAIKPFWSKDGA